MKINIIYSNQEILNTAWSSRILFSIILIINILSATSLYSQETNSFQAEVIVGINLSQLDGDQLSGFDKLGLRSGFRISRSIDDRKGIALDLLYDQRGSSSGIISGGGFRQFIALDYISFPLSMYFDSWWIEDLGRNRMRFYVSAIPARLIATRSSHDGFDQATDDFKKWDLSLAIGLRYAIGVRSAVDLRLERSLLRIYQSPSSQLSSLQSYLISVQFNYLLNQ